MDYTVPPGLYAIGKPDPDSPVLVTANYKMSYDIVRNILGGRNCWLLVLETYGINVWCAAGKGTFGTEELIYRLNASALAKVVNHRRLLLPILGAPGVAAHEVAKQTGFHIRYAAIRARDLPEYLDNGMQTTPEMREITFTTWERVVLIPVELVEALKPTLIVALAIFAVLAALQGQAAGFKGVLAYLGAVLAGTAMTPFLLPWLPLRSFAFKGFVIGLIWTMVFYFLAGGNDWGLPLTMAAFLILPAVSAFYALGFTGCTPFTSRSGVKKEMRIALPTMGCALLAGIFVALLGKFL
jgi:acetyl-CoA decarbonylase/synthase complex subunit gamma